MDALPWIELVEAEARLTEVQRSGDRLAIGSAVSAVEDAKLRCGALFAEMFLHAARSDGIRQLLGELVESLGPVDWSARQAADEAVSDVARLREENWQMANAIVDLQERLALLERRMDGLAQDERRTRQRAGSASGPRLEVVG